MYVINQIYQILTNMIKIITIFNFILIQTLITQIPSAISTVIIPILILIKIKINQKVIVYNKDYVYIMNISK